MKRTLCSILFLILLCSLIPLPAGAEALLIPGGQLVGLSLRDDAVTIAAFDEAGGTGARDAGLRIGDRILKIDGRDIGSGEDVRNALDSCGPEVELTILRGSRQQTVHMTPQQTAEGPRLGIYLRQGIAGIGTVTFFDPETGRFGTLGHGVNDGKGNLMHMTDGIAYDASILSVKKGTSGDPGQLRGNAEDAIQRGTLLKNTPQGVFGISRRGWKGEALPVADYQDVTLGPATIRSTVSGSGLREYSVEILKIYPKDRPDCRNFLLKVTDPALLESTGGIVQGMGVSYNRDNQEKPLACNGFWCCPYFPRVKGNSRIPCAGMPGQNHLMPVIAAEGEIFCGGNKHTYFYSIKQLSIIPATQDGRCRAVSVTPFGVFCFTVCIDFFQECDIISTH